MKEVSRFADSAAVSKVGEESFRVCDESLDDMVVVSNDEICSAIKDGTISLPPILSWKITPLSLNLSRNSCSADSLFLSSLFLSLSDVVRRLGLGICPSTSQNHTLTHPHTLLITCTCCYDQIKGTQLKTKISLTHSLILFLSLSHYHLYLLLL